MKETNWRKSLVECLLGVAVALLFCSFIAIPIVVNGSSMYPNLKNGNIGLSSKMFDEDDIERFDIVVLDTGEKKIIKRVVGMPGETIRYTDNKLYINDEFVEENFIDTTTEDFYAHVPDGEYFCLGDNRMHSADSRYYGTFKFEQIVSKGVVLLIPPKGIIN